MFRVGGKKKRRGGGGAVEAGKEVGWMTQILTQLSLCPHPKDNASFHASPAGTG